MFSRIWENLLFSVVFNVSSFNIVPPEFGIITIMRQYEKLTGCEECWQQQGQCRYRFLVLAKGKGLLFFEYLSNFYLHTNGIDIIISFQIKRRILY